MEIKETEKKLFKILTEYGRIHEDDILILYRTYHYGRKRIRQMFAEKYLKTVNAVIEDEGANNVTSKSRKGNNSSLINKAVQGVINVVNESEVNNNLEVNWKADEGDIDVTDGKEENDISAVRSKGNEGVRKSKRLKYSLVQLTAKAKKEIKDEELIFYPHVTTRIVSMEKQRKQTKTALILDKLGIEILESNYNQYDDRTDKKWFEQSTAVKQHSKALNNHSRIMGILYSPGGDYAIYNIGDGTGKWYISEEGTITEVNRYGREISKMIIMVKSSKAEDTIKAQKAFEENIYREIDKRTKDRTFVLPTGINMCSILPDDEKGYEMLENMTYKDWKLKIAQYCLGASEVKEAKIMSADFSCREWNVYIMVHNDLDARENIKNYQAQMANTRTAGRDVIIICLDTDEEYYKNLFSIYTKKEKEVIKEVTVKIIPISREEVKEVCRADEIFDA